VLTVPKIFRERNLSKEFCRAALEDLIKRIIQTDASNQSLFHMLVLPRGKSVRIPLAASQPIGSRDCPPPGLFTFGVSKIATPLPPKECWPELLPPLRAVTVDQDFHPYKPLSREPYRVHLFFGHDESAVQNLLKILKEIIGLDEDLQRAVFGRVSQLSELIFNPKESRHGDDEVVIDRWMCTLHWWAWKVKGAPFSTRPQIVFGNKGIPTNFLDPAIGEKLAFSWIEQNIFSCTIEVLRIFMKFMDEPPNMAYSSMYFYEASVDNKEMDYNSAKPISIGERKWSYFVDRKLGSSGGNGTVYEGISESGSIVAVKQLKIALTHSPEARELEIVENLVGKTYRHVIPVLDCGRDPNTLNCYVVMAKGEKSLADACESGPFKLSEAVQALIEIGQGLKEVYDIVHRDIKPENILLHEGKWKLTDFGISRFVDAATASETHRKKLSSRYASPEQWKEERATHASDIYSLGCLAYFLIAGHPPFSGPDREDYREQHLYSPPPRIPIEDYRLVTLVNMMMQKKVAARPTIDKVLSVLRNCKEEVTPSKNSALPRLAELAAKVEHEKAEATAKKLSKLTELDIRLELGRNAYSQLSTIANDFLQDITFAVPNIVKRTSGPGLRAIECQVGNGSLLIEFDESSAHAASDFSHSGWDVVASGVIGVTQACPEYRWWSSLWYAKPTSDAPSYRWYEVAFFTSPLVGKPRRFEPFHLSDDIKNADMAMSSVMGEIRKAYEPMPIDVEAKAEFFQRWTERFADAVDGSLARPSVFPIR
jgi:serine/threonine-protein kinase